MSQAMRERPQYDLGPKALRDALDQPSKWAHLHRAVEVAPKDRVIQGVHSEGFFPLESDWDEDFAK